MKKFVIVFMISAVITAAAILAVLELRGGSTQGHPVSSAPSIVSEVTFESIVDPSETTADGTDYSAMPINNTNDALTVISAFAADNGLDPSDYPTEMIDLLARNPDALDFVLNFPLHEAEADPDIDLSGEVNRYEVPRLYQWDQRWGYKIYGSGPMGLTGCGPTCLSMVAIHLLGNTDMNPAWMADYAMNNGYYDYDDMSGTYWALMTDGAYGLGIDVVEIPTDEGRMVRNLDVGNPIIAIMGEGEFTDGGHFIVITGYEDGYFTINDPNSVTRSERLWTFDELAEEMITCWVFRIL